MKKKFAINDDLANAISDTLSLAEKRAGSLVVESIYLEDIELDPNNPRELNITLSDIKKGNINFDEDDPRYKEVEDLHSLGETIKEHGLINPILVYQDKGKYKLVAGERRTLATWLVGLKNIPARILQRKPDQDKISILQWIENIERVPINLWEKMKNLRTLLDASALSVSGKNISSLIGCSVRNGTRYASILKIKDEEILESIRAGKINNIKKAISLSKLNKDERDSLSEEEDISELSQSTLQKKAFKKTKQKPKTKANNISLSISSTHHAKLIFNAISKDPNLSVATDMVVEPDWSNYNSVCDALKELSGLLEEVPVK